MQTDLLGLGRGGRGAPGLRRGLPPGVVVFQLGDPPTRDGLRKVWDSAALAQS